MLQYDIINIAENDIYSHYSLVESLVEPISTSDKAIYQSRMVKCINEGFAVKTEYMGSLKGFLYCYFDNYKAYGVSLYNNDILALYWLAKELLDRHKFHKGVFMPHNGNITLKSLVTPQSLKRYRTSKLPLTILRTTIYDKVVDTLYKRYV